MKRVSVVGNSGSGKSTLAGALASHLGVRYVELDALFHLPEWAELPPEEFRRQVTEIVDTAGWVVDGNYAVVRDIVWSRADTVVWVDPPHPLVMARIVRRTLHRTLTRQVLWQGNREPWSNLTSWDPQRSVIAWAWARRNEYRSRYGAASMDPALSHLRFVRIRNGADRQRLLDASTR